MNNNKDYLEIFDRVFKTNTKKTVSNLGIIERIFDDIENDLYVPDENYREETLKIINELEKDFTEKQRKLADELFLLEGKNSREYEKSLFMFGFILGNELRRETFETYKRRDKISIS